MATAKPPPAARPDRTRSRPPAHRWRNLLLALLVLGALGIALCWNGLHARAVLAVSYGARIACTCRYVEGRELKDCRRDFEPGMALVMLSDEAAARRITARVPLVASQSATFRDGPGCLLQGWTR